MKYFIPEVKTVNGIQIPSTPFRGVNNTTIFLADVIKLSFEEGETEHALVKMVDGQYICTTGDNGTETPLWCLDTDSIIVIGCSEESPELLSLLS